MARQREATAELEEEIFTDLEGQTEGKDPPAPRDRESTLIPQGDKEKVDDADLEVSDEDDDEDGDGAAVIDPADEEEEEIPEVEETRHVAPVDVIDPRDVQILALEAKGLETTKGTLTDALKRAEEDMVAAEAAMLVAKEAGDTKGDIAATKAYAAAMTAQNTAKARLENLGGEEQALIRKAQALMAKAPVNPETGKRDIHYRAPATAAVEKPAGSKLAPKFIKQNAAWFNNSKYAKQRERLHQIDKGLEAEGQLNINTPEYFAELAKRFNREHPGLVKGLDGKAIATGQRRRQAGATIPNGGGGSGTPPAGSGGSAANKVKLTNADLDQMKTFGLDSDDKKVRAQWLIEKRALARQGA